MTRQRLKEEEAMRADERGYRSGGYGRQNPEALVDSIWQKETGFTGYLVNGRPAKG